MKILLTGGNGFIARNLSEKLGPEYQIFSYSSQTLDLLDPSQVFDHIKEGKFDVVIHAATYDPVPKDSAKDPAKVLQNNLAMFFNLLRCRDHFGRMIYFGSGAEYDRTHWRSNMREDYFDRHVPADQYGFSKYIMTKHALSNDGIYNIRIFSVFGKYEDWRYRFISRACCQAVMGLPITISRNASYDFLYIDDLANIVKWFIENKPQKSVYNACAGQVYNFKTLAGMIREISGKDIAITIKEEGPVMEYGGDNSLLLNEMKDFRITPIQDSIKALYGWYDLNRHIIDRNELV